MQKSGDFEVYDNQKQDARCRMNPALILSSWPYGIHALRLDSSWVRRIPLAFQEYLLACNLSDSDHPI